MRTSIIDSAKRPVAVTLVVALALFLVDVRAYAHSWSQDEGRIENARWALVGSLVVITYDLVADPEFRYNIGIVLKRGSDKNFRIVPRTVSGAIGIGRFAGSGREIHWDYKKDVSQGLYGDDYEFEVTAYQVDEGGSGIWVYLLGGAAVAGGGAYLLLGKPAAAAPR